MLNPASPANTEAAPTPAAREAWGDALKGVLILLVVLWHVIMKTYLQVDWRIGLPLPGAWGLIGDLIWSFMMPLFLLVSGYFAANSITRPWAEVVRTRIARFLYLYLLWTLIHMAAMWSFRDFPTLIPRSAAEFFEYVTLDPPSTWYLYALAVYFLIAKALHRVPPWVLIGAAAAISVVVSVGSVEALGNRGSLLYNYTFFLLGLHLAPQVGRFVSRVRPSMLMLLAAGHLVAFAAMRLTSIETLPGVWLFVSLAGSAMGLAAAPVVARIPAVGAGLSWLGERTLPVYLIHMPLLALADYALYEPLSGARLAVQLPAAVFLPVVLSALVVAACLFLDQLRSRDGVSWLFDLPHPALPNLPWRAASAVVVLAVTAAAAGRVNAIAGCPAAFPVQEAGEPGQVSIAGVGDLLIYDAGHAVPDDGGAGYFEAVRPWFTQDLVTGNLEQVISEDTGFNKCGADPDCLAFRSGPEAAQYFAGFDLLTLANNHTGDFGAEGYANTAANLAAAGVRTVGERNEVSCTAVGDITVAVIGFSPYGQHNRIADLRHTRNVVEAAARTADVVVVHVEMGAEGPEANAVKPGAEQMYGEHRGDVMAFSRTAIDAGADLVLGHGPHSLRGME
ncbi:MAG: acyltransferase family protein, partial [Dehalococcoidia bacterium]